MSLCLSSWVFVVFLFLFGDSPNCWKCWKGKIVEFTSNSHRSFKKRKKKSEKNLKHLRIKAPLSSLCCKISTFSPLSFIFIVPFSRELSFLMLISQDKSVIKTMVTFLSSLLRSGNKRRSWMWIEGVIMSHEPSSHAFMDLNSRYFDSFNVTSPLREITEQFSIFYNLHSSIWMMMVSTP